MGDAAHVRNAVLPVVNAEQAVELLLPAETAERKGAGVEMMPGEQPAGKKGQQPCQDKIEKAFKEAF